MLYILESLDWDNSPTFIDDWMQANWELLVEKHLLKSGQYLTSYGYDISSECRYSDKGVSSTHQVVCRRKDQPTGTTYIFLCFLTKRNGVHKIEPPFDLIDIKHNETGERFAIPFDQVHFSAIKIS